MTEHHAGRLIDHVHIRVRDLEASKRFFSAALESLGLGLTWEGDGAFAVDELYVSDDGESTAGLHLAFQAAGGTDNGGPGERDYYHPGYFSAYVLDPDGNNVEAVYHGPARRSAESVVIVPEN